MTDQENQLRQCHEVIKRIKWLCDDRRINNELSRQWIDQYIKDWMKGREVGITDNWMLQIDGIEASKLACEAGKGAKRP